MVAFNHQREETVLQFCRRLAIAMAREPCLIPGQGEFKDPDWPEAEAMVSEYLNCDSRTLLIGRRQDGRAFVVHDSERLEALRGLGETKFKSVEFQSRGTDHEAYVLKMVEDRIYGDGTG